MTTVLSVFLFNQHKPETSASTTQKQTKTQETRTTIQPPNKQDDSRGLGQEKGFSNLFSDPEFKNYGVNEDENDSDFSTFPTGPDLQQNLDLNSSIATSPNFKNNAPMVGEYNLYSKDGKYLGKINGNPYDLDSINNPYGQYGSKYSSDSINNPYGEYGSKYSNESPWNKYSTGGPSVYDYNGNYVGDYSVNKYDADSVLSPYSPNYYNFK